MNDKQTQQSHTLPLANDHNVYILGAGFSAEGGLPTVPEFLNRMRDSHPWLLDHGRKEEAFAVQQVLDFRLKATSASYWTRIDLENIEELFSLASIKDGDEPLPRNIRTAIAATLDYAWQTSARKTCQVIFRDAASKIFDPVPSWLKKLGQTGVPSNTYEAPFYSYLSGRLLGVFNEGKIVGENTFITFNYDCLLEDGLASMGIPFSYGFAHDHVTFFQGSQGCAEEQSIHVLKVHGSVNWRLGYEQGTAFDKLVVFKDYEAARGPGVPPELVPPTWNKSFAPYLRDVWSDAVRKVRTATRIVIIGFSMPTTDLHFKYLLAAGLKENISLRQILFVNRNTENLKPRVLSTFRHEHVESGKIQFEANALGAYLGRIGMGHSIGRPVKSDTLSHIS